MNTDIITKFTPIHGENLSEAWAKAFITCLDAPGGSMAPGIIHFDAVNDEENLQVRSLLEQKLDAIGIRSANTSPIETVAGTIFPQSLWELSKFDRDKFFDTYNRIWPQIEKCPANKKGVYFRRLTSFGNGQVNQLNDVIATWNRGTRRHSALQAAIFDPLQDHSPARRRGFPCLQQVIFHPNGAHGKEGLSVVALYANQLLLDKAYGNYLGLYRLGKFMAFEMGICLKDVLCIASNLKISDSHGAKRDNKPLAEALKKELKYDQ